MKRVQSLNPMMRALMRAKWKKPQWRMQPPEVEGAEGAAHGEGVVAEVEVEAEVGLGEVGPGAQKSAEVGGGDEEEEEVHAEAPALGVVEVHTEHGGVEQEVVEVVLPKFLRDSQIYQ